jgi:hypothetical protein
MDTDFEVGQKEIISGCVATFRGNKINMPAAVFSMLTTNFLIRGASLVL